MSAPTGTFYDGASGPTDGSPDYWLIPRAHGPAVPRTNTVTRSLIIEQTYRQLAPKFVRAAWSLAGPRGSFLVDETKPRDFGGGMVEWQRIFAQLPPDRNEYREVVHNYQGIESGDSPSIVELAVTVQMTTTYTYKLIADGVNPATVFTLAKAFKYVKLGTDILLVGTPPASNASIILHEDETVSRWMGNIYEKVSKSVPQFSWDAV